ncbi:MAG: hypothetical protein HXS44_10035 [Theionarchaea archaeon]|nr:hypothetical protein [Theionarchaea archaeon]
MYRVNGQWTLPGLTISLESLCGSVVSLLYIEAKIGRGYLIYPALYLVIGAFSVILYCNLCAVLTRPRTRICDHFLLNLHDEYVISWNQVSKVRVKGNYLYLILPEKRIWKKYPVSIQDSGGLIDYVEDICKSRGIPLERVTAFRGNEPGDRKEDVDGDGI